MITCIMNAVDGNYGMHNYSTCMQRVIKVTLKSAFRIHLEKKNVRDVYQNDPIRKMVLFILINACEENYCTTLRKPRSIGEYPCYMCIHVIISLSSFRSSLKPVFTVNSEIVANIFFANSVKKTYMYLQR